MAAPDTRDAEAGVTLVEVLVVLALVGILAGTVGLRLGERSGAGAAGDRAAELLASRLNAAAEAALLSGRGTAFVWSADGYGLEAGSAVHALPRGLTLRDETGATAGRYAIGPDLLPDAGRPLRLRIGAGGPVLRFDGARAVLEGS